MPQYRWRPLPSIKQTAPAVLIACFTSLTALSPSAAQDAAKILKDMSDYVTAQKNLMLTYDSDVEVVTSDLQKIQFTSSGQAALSRPDKLRVSRTGGYADVELIFDGKTFTLYGKNIEAYAQVPSSGTVDQLIDRIREHTNVPIPGGDLLLSRLFEEVTQDVVDAKHIGEGVIDNVNCQHLAFRGPDVDWQIWIETGPRPVPRKYVLTSKHVTGAPQYTLRIKEWRTESFQEDAFVFKPAAGARKVEFTQMTDLDDVPVATGQGAGGRK